MSKDKHHEPLHEMEQEVLPVDPGDPKWKRWFLDLHIALQDQDAVLHDQLRKKRKRDLGPREARRLYRESRDRLRDLLAAAGGGGDDGDGGGHDPAMSTKPKPKGGSGGPEGAASALAV